MRKGEGRVKSGRRAGCAVLWSLIIFACARGTRPIDPGGGIFGDAAADRAGVEAAGAAETGDSSAASSDLITVTLDESDLDAASPEANEAMGESASRPPEDAEAGAGGRNAASSGVKAGGGTFGGLSFDASVIAGYRDEAKLRLRWRRGFSVGLRVCDGWRAGYLRYEGDGPVRTLHVGRMSVRAAERLSVGRGFGAYGAPGTGRVAEGFAAAASLSRWSGVNGAAAELGWARWRFHCAALADPALERSARPERVWAAAIHGFARGAIGFQTAHALDSLPGGGARESGGPGPAPPLPGLRWRAVSGWGWIRGDGFGGSIELSRMGGCWFFAGRLVGSGGKDRWSLFVYRAPYDVPSEGPGPGPPGKTEQGMTLGASTRRAGCRASAWLTAARTASEEERGVARRLILQVEGGGRGPVAWQARAYGRDRCEEDLSSSPVVREVVRRPARDLTLRGVVSIRGAGSVRVVARIDHTPACDGAGAGTVVALTSVIQSARAEARIALAGHALGAGRRGWISRPGVGAFEWFGTLWGRGSDLSMRLRVHLTSTSGVVLFYGSSWRGDTRWYAGAECRY